ncbi:hypothetical protein ACXZ9C_10575 [Streptococcus agalactiae]
MASGIVAWLVSVGVGGWWSVWLVRSRRRSLGVVGGGVALVASSR